ncbi:helix-turn-helix domain-containing protein [Ktedonospora formicarum]|uniref:AraC family transcriptional regulator n=1 Tax=Ktedonospora formicarum TaxID=2778364 RepID=A0A8J3MYF2_9CHLR|nr:helix-turn-helix domain-containing protein [Ktedonospora formicarum]GHO50743.1 AraC family transcriptional regulator [Ktedonospora formicarum]
MEERQFQLTCYQSARDLAHFVEHYWIVTWDFRGQGAYLAEILPHPRVHLVIAKDQSRVFGVVKGAFSYRYEESSCVFGVRFKPGAVYPLLHMPLAQFTNTSLSIKETLGIEDAVLEKALLLQEDKAAMIEYIEHFLRKGLPERDEHEKVIQQILDHIVTNREISRVEDLVSRFNLSKRTLQRLFHQYVGVSPKWVIQHYRLHEVARRLTEGDGVEWSQLALDLGYCDQAHFSRAFKATVGKAPAAYAKTVGADSSASSTCVILHKVDEV